MASALRIYRQLELSAAYWNLVLSFVLPVRCALFSFFCFPISKQPNFLSHCSSRVKSGASPTCWSRLSQVFCGFSPAWKKKKKKTLHLWTPFFFLFFCAFSPDAFFLSTSSSPPRSITRVSDAQAGLWAGSGQVWVRFSTTSAVNSSGSTRCGWAPSPAAPNYRRQWHHRVSGLLAVIMRGPTPGVRAPVRVSGFF